MGIPKVIEIMLKTILKSVLTNVKGLMNSLGGNQPKTCFEKRAEAAAAAAAEEQKKGWCRKFAVAAKAAWQEGRLTHPIVFSSIAVLMGMFGVAAWRRALRGSDPRCPTMATAREPLEGASLMAYISWRGARFNLQQTRTIAANK